MFCTNCGRQVNEEAYFCPFCGNDIRTDTEEETAVAGHNKKSRKRIGVIIASLAAVVTIALVLAFPVRLAAEKAVVKATAEEYLQIIKDGPSEETVDGMMAQLLYEATGNQIVTSLIHSRIKGQDLKDIYDALMLHYSYQIAEVERLSTGHYKITVQIANMDNTRVASLAWKNYKAKYEGTGILDGIKQLKADLKGDISTAIAAYLAGAADDLFEADDNANTVAGTYLIDVEKKNGKWEPYFEDGLTAFIFDCAGIPVSEGDLNLLNSIISE